MDNLNYTIDYNYGSNITEDITLIQDLEEIGKRKSHSRYGKSYQKVMQGAAKDLTTLNIFMGSHLGHYSTLDLKVFTENGFNNIIFYHKSNFQGRFPCKAPGLFIFNMNH